jgi:hypothetical protein
MKYSFLAGLVCSILCSSVFARTVTVTVTVPDAVSFSRCFVKQFQMCRDKGSVDFCEWTGYYYGLFGESEFGTETIAKDLFGTQNNAGGYNQIAASYSELREPTASLREMYQLGQALKKKGICSGIEFVR